MSGLTGAQRKCYAKPNLGFCAYRPIPTLGNDPVPYTYNRMILDWRADRRLLSEHIRWRQMRTLYPVTSLYIIEGEAEFSKIGISDKPDSRLQNLQTSHWSNLSIHSLLWVWNGEAKLLEENCHAAARIRGIEVRGEWVKMPAAEAVDLVLEVAAALDVQATGPEALEIMLNEETKARSKALKDERFRAAQEKAARLGY